MSRADPESDTSRSARADDAPDPEAEPSEDAARDRETRRSDAGRQPDGDAAELQESIEAHYQELEAHYDEIRAVLDEYNRSAREFIRNHPGISIAGALGFGYVVGRLASRRWLE